MPKATHKHRVVGYKWSTHNDNNYLRTTYWPKVKDGLINTSRDLKVRISSHNLEWLGEFNGQYCRFMPKDCRIYLDNASNKYNRGKNATHVISEI